MTSRYGDLLKELLQPMNADPAKLAEVQRVFNEFSDRETIYESWMQFGGKMNPLKMQLPFEVIYSNVLSVDMASITVPIPSTYKHLLIMGTGRTNGAGAGAVYVFGRLNGDSAGNYIQQKFTAFDTTLTGEQNTGQTGALVGMAVEGGDPNSEAAGVFFAVIPHYLSNYSKDVLMFSYFGGGVRYTGTYWGISDPISSIVFLPVTDSFAAGFVLSVYGIL